MIAANKHLYHSRYTDIKTTYKLYILVAIFFFFFSSESVAQITFDFAPDDKGYMSNQVIHSGSLITGQTPFLNQDVKVNQPNPFGGGNFVVNIQMPEIVNIDGVNYYHLVVGDPLSNFAQEVYIQRGFTRFPNGQVGSASGSGRSNGADPLNPATGGNGTGTPTRVMLKQIVKDEDMTMTFTKGKLDAKPVITQAINTTNISLYTKIDMSNSSYSDDSKAGLMINTLKLISGNPGDAGDFDMTLDQQNSIVTAGRYTYTDGSGPGGAAGVYNYVDGDGFGGSGFIDPLTVDWNSYVQDQPDNIWSYSNNDPFP